MVELEIAEGAALAPGMDIVTGSDLELFPEFNLSLCHSLNYSTLLAHNMTDDCADAYGKPLHVGLMTVIQIFYALVCIVGLCGNTLVIYVVLRYSKMQTVTNKYILNLALADECFLVGIPFLIVTSAQGDWIFGMTMCKIYLTTTSINQFTSSIFLTVMSADRYIAVCHPISSPRFRTNLIANLVSLTAWFTSAVLVVPVLMYAATITKPDGGQNCNIFWPFDDEEEFDAMGLPVNGSAVPVARPMPSGDGSSMRPPVLNGQTAFTFYSFVLGFALPLMLILVFYILVIFKLKTVGPKNKSKEKKKSHRKVTRLVLTVITVYILCWLPYWITQLALIFTPPGHTQDNIMVAVMLLAGCLSYSNSAMNPVLYAFLSENFKKSFMKACTCAMERDANNILHIENSAFPRRRTLGGSTRGRTGGNGGGFGGNNRARGANAGNDFKKEGCGLLGQELNDVSTGHGTRSTSRSYENHSQVSNATCTTTTGHSGGSRVNGSMCSSISMAEKSSTGVDSGPINGGPNSINVSLKTTTFNGSLAPPQMV